MPVQKRSRPEPAYELAPAHVNPTVISTGEPDSTITSEPQSPGYLRVQQTDEERDEPNKSPSTLRRVNQAVTAIPSLMSNFFSTVMNIGHRNDVESGLSNPEKDDTSGNITFKGSQGNGAKCKRYIKIDPSEKPDVVMNILKSKWDLQPPKLLISILCGKKSDDVLMRDVKRDLCKGLVKTVLSTDVWLFTNGLQRGLIKSMGEALTEHATGRALVTHRDLVAVGITPLGILPYSNQFKRIVVEQEGSQVVQLDHSKLNYKDSDLLEPNHTHFILVGDESHGPGVEAKIRDELVKEIATKKTKGTTDSHGRYSNCEAAVADYGSLSPNRMVAVLSTSPVVYLLFDGDASVFDTLVDAVTNNIPIVVFPETKGAAEVLVKVIQMANECAYLNIEFDTGVKELIERTFNVDGKGAVEIKNQIQIIISCPHLIEIFQHDKTEVDIVILQALMKARQGATVTPYTVTHSASASVNDHHEIMRLFVLFNRIDLATENFDKTSRIWQNTELVKELLHYALVSDQHEFVKFFIEAGGVDMKEFLTSDKLKSLYNEMSKDSILFLLLEHYTKKKTDSDEILLADVENLLKKLAFDSYDAKYPTGAEKRTYEDPLKELFLWAVLQDRIPMAKLFWKLGKPSVGGALVGNKLLQAMSQHKLMTDAQKKANMLEHAKEFQQIAIEMLNACYAEDRRRTSDLLVRIMPEWGGATCLEIAAEAKSKHFIAQAPVQNLLSELWRGRLAQMTHWLTIGLCVFLPVLSIWLITFTAKDDPSVPLKKQKRLKPPFSSDDMDGDHLNEQDTGDSNNRRRRSWRVDRLWCLGKLKLFWKAPIVSFGYNMISQFIFLGLFSYIILANFTEEVSVWEIVLMVWVFTIFTEEIRQVMQEDYQTWYHQVSDWFWGYWNCIDLVSLVMFAIGVGLRFHPATLDAARIVLALDLMVFYFRILHICSANEALGPKLIMIAKMMVDLLSFVCILLVFLIAYGVACQAILYPNTQEPEDIARGILYRSYFQLYGELFLDLHRDCAVNETQFMEGLDSCPSHSWFATVSLAFYLFVSNILLLNLLIAMLNYTFTAVQENTDAFWKFQRYQLIREYYRRPVVAPPFIVVVHGFLLIRYIWNKWRSLTKCCPNSEIHKAPSLMKRNMEHKAVEMRAWESIKGQDYLAAKKAEGHKESVKKILAIEKKLDDISAKVEHNFEALGDILRKMNLGYERYADRGLHSSSIN